MHRQSVINFLRPVLRMLLRQMMSSRKYRTLTIFADKSENKNYAEGEPELTIHFKTVKAELRTIILFWEGFFEKYIDGDIDLIGLRPITKIAEMGHATNVPLAHLGGHHKHGYKYAINPLNVPRKILQEWLQSNWRHAVANAKFHYSYPMALWEHMLGETVGYSEGYWTRDTKTLNQAKHNVYEYICKKLRLQPGDKVLEVGAGWGFQAIYMVKNYDVDVTIYNPVTAQNDYMRKRFAAHGVANRIRIVEGTHADILKEDKRSYDKFVTVGVHEHHGMELRLYDQWWKGIDHVLKEGGIGLVSCTCYNRRAATNYLLLKYIFPGGHLPSLPNELMAMDGYNLMWVEIENLWPHYQKTVEQWRNRFHELWPKIRESNPGIFTERFRRLWSMYLECTVENFSSSLDLMHLTFVKGRSSHNYPWTREEKNIADFKENDDAVECYSIVPKAEAEAVPSPYFPDVVRTDGGTD
jgi:cyclopropane-fatty-acyl-phospholipid synthase